MEIYLIRHGKSDWNTIRRCQGDLDTPVLNEEGKEQSMRLGTRLSGIKFDRIFCSPLRRARQTCEIALKKMGIEDYEVVEGLRERVFGSLVGRL